MKYIVDDSFLDKVQDMLETMQEVDRDTIQVPRWHVAIMLESLYRDMYNAADKVGEELECGFDVYKEEMKK